MKDLGEMIKKIPMSAVELCFSIAGYIESAFLRINLIKNELIKNENEHEKKIDKINRELIINRVKREILFLKPAFVPISLLYLSPFKYFILSISFESVFSLILVAFVVRRVLSFYGLDPKKEKEDAIHIVSDVFREYYPALLKVRGRNLLFLKNLSERKKKMPFFIKNVISELFFADMLVERVIEEFEKRKSIK